MQAIHLVYRILTDVQCRESHVEHFDPKVQFMHILEVFQKIIKEQQVAICLKLHSYLQVNLQLCCRVYTCWTDLLQQWDIEKVMWSILIQTASLYTSQKYFKWLIKHQLVAICLQLYSYLQLNICKFAALLQDIHLLYRFFTTVECI